MNLLNIEHISKIYGEKIIFDDASFGVQEGDKIGIVGINGTGKTTLLRMIAGTEVPDDGQIIRQNGMKIAHLTQNPVFPEGATILSYVQSVAEDMEWRVQSNLNTLGIAREFLISPTEKQRFWQRTLICFFWTSPPIIWMEK